MNRKQRRAGAPGGNDARYAAFAGAFNQGLALQQAGDLDGAAAAYRKAMTLDPKHAMLHNNLGVVLYAQGKLPEAIAIYQKAIALDPSMAMTYNNLGVSLNALGRHAEAIPHFRQAIALNPNNPQALNNLGDSLVKSSHFAEGYAELQKAIALYPEYAEAFSNMGMALWGLGQLDEAIATLRKSIAMRPDLAMPRKNLGLVLLLLGSYAEGWIEYSWRFKADNIPFKQHPKPVWQGQDLGEGALLVWSEQGVGDEILHAGMMADFAAKMPRVIWETDARLVSLLQRSCPTVKVVARTAPPAPETVSPEVAAHFPAGNLGQFVRNDRAQFPSHGGYLVADAARSAAYRAGLKLAPGEKLVGISWLSQNAAFGESKSTRLADWADILRTPGVRFVDLQYGDTAAERAALQKNHGLTLEHVEGLDLRRDLDGVAALTAACDMVITVSNTAAHVAGGLGVPTLVLVAAGVGKFWYWGYDGETTPWYPSITIIRQPPDQDWTEPLRVVAGRLRAGL